MTECPYCGHRLRRRAPKLPRMQPRRGRAGCRRGGIGTRWAAAGRAGARGRRRARRGPLGPVGGHAALRDDRAGRRLGRDVGGRARRTCAAAPHAGDRTAPRRVVADLHLPVRPTSRAAAEASTRSWRSSPRACSAGSWSVATGRRSCSRCSSAPAPSARWPPTRSIAAPFLSGANAGALALVAAWAGPDLRSLRRGEYYEGDLLGAGAFAALLLAIPFARPEASWLAGVIGGLLGLAIGLGMASMAESEG